MEKLLNNIIDTSVPFAWSHGAKDEYLGTGLMYYSLIYINKLVNVLIFGTGGGFVPSIIRQAHNDLNIGKITIVDNLSGIGDESNHARQTYRKIKNNFVWHKTSTEDFCISYFKKPPIVYFDYIHIDANHDFEYVYTDLKYGWKMLKTGGFITVHDTDINSGLTGPNSAVKYFITNQKAEILNIFTENSNGLTILRKINQ